MTDIASLNIKIDTSDAKTAKNDLDKMTSAGKNAESQMGSMSNAAVKLGKALAAAFVSYKIAQFTKDVVMAAARYETLGVVMLKVGENAGYTASQVTSFSNQIRESGIQMDTARKVTIRMIQAQIDMSQASKLARIAQDAAVIGQINSSEALERMIHGIQSAETEIMKGIGLNVSFEKAYKTLAKQLGVNKDSLTEQQKMQARVNETMEVAKAIAGSYEASMTTAGKQIDSFTRYIGDFKIEMGKAFNPATAQVVKSMTEAMKELTEAVSSPEIQSALGAIAQDFADWVSENKTLISQNLPEYIAGFETALKSMGAIADGVFTVLTTLNSAMENLAINAKAAGMASGGAMSWGTFLTSTTNELKKAVADFDSSFDPKVVSKDFSSVFAEHFKKAETATTAIVTASTTANTAAKKKGLTEQEKALKKSLEEQKRALESFHDAYKKATLSTFDYEVDKLDEEYEYFKSQKADALRLEEWYAEEYFRINQEDIARYYDAQEQKIAAQKKRQEKQLKLEQEVAKESQEMRYNMLQDLGGSDSYDVQVQIIEDYAKKYIDLTHDIVTAEAWKNNEIQKLNAETARKDIEEREGNFADIASNLDSIAALYEEGSSKQKAATAAANVAHAAEMAMLVQKNIMFAVGAVANQGTGDPYTAFARIAAMTAAMAGILSIANISFSSSGGSGGGATMQSTGRVSGAGTVLGGTSALSDSIGNTIELLNDIEANQYDTLIDIFYEMQDLNTNITGLASSIVQDYGTFSAKSLGISEGYIPSDFETWGDTAESFAEQFFGIAGDFGTAWLSKTVTGWVGDLVSDVFGGGQTKELVGAGFLVSPYTSGGELLVQSYQDVAVEEDGGWFHSDDHWTETHLQAVDPEITKYFSSILSSFSNMALDLVDELGVSSAEAVSSYTFDIGKINLKDLTGEEISETLTTVFSEVGDELVESLFYDAVAPYQEIGEGLFETAGRIVASKNIVQSAFDDMGISFDFTASEAIEFSQGLILLAGDIDTFQREFESFYESFYSSFEKQSTFLANAENIIKNIDETISFPQTEEAFKDLVMGLDITTESGRKLYTELMSLSDGATEYYSYLTEIEDFNNSMQDIIDTDSLSSYELSLKSLNDWYEEQKETAIDLGISLNDLNIAYNLQIQSLNDTSEAMRIVTLAIEGQLTVAQKFEEWQIENIEAMNLFSEMAANSVTADELESAVDAFAALGIEGDDLSNVIQDLADTFTEATQQMYENISDIESAQGDLTGSDDTIEAYLNSMASVVEFFKDTPSLAQIRGDEQYITTEFDEDAYKAAIAEAVVNSEFQSILGRNAASNNPYESKILEGSLSLDDLHQAIINGISNSEDRVNEIFNRLFGRSASTSYWADALDAGLVSSDNLELSILRGAAATDLAYYNENQGKVEITNWEDFATAAGLVGVSADDFYTSKINTNTGEFSTSEAEVEAALEILNSLPDVIDSSGNLISSALDEFVNKVGNMDSAVLEDIFGSAAAAQISAMVSAISDYESSLESDSGTSGSETSTDDTQDQIDAIFAQIQEGIDTINLSDFEKEIYDINKQAQEWTDSLAELGVTAAEDLAIIDEWVNAQRTALAEGIAEEWQNIINENSLSDTDLQLIALDAWFDDQKAAATELGMSLDALTEAYDLQISAIDAARQAEIDSLLESASDYLDKSGMSDFESQMIDLEKEAASLNEQLTALNATNEELAVITEWLSTKERELIDARQAEIDAFNDTIQDIISQNTLSDLEYELEGLTDWYEEQKAAAEDLGIALDAVNEAYDLQKEAAYDSAVATARTAYIESLQEEQTILEDALSTAKDNYINGLNDEIDALNETASEAEKTAESFESLLETIKELKYSSVTDSELNPDKQMAFVGAELAAAMAKIQSGDAAEIQAGMEDLPTLTSDFLALSKQTSGSFSAYQNDFAYVMRILNEAEQIAGDQKSTAEFSLDELTSQTEALEATLDAVNGVNENLGTLEELEAAYNSAKTDLDNSWYQDEIDRLTEINSSVLSLEESVIAYMGSLAGAVNAGISKYQSEYAATISPLAAQASSSPSIPAIADNPLTTNFYEQMMPTTEDALLMEAAKVVYESATGGISSEIFNAYSSRIEDTFGTNIFDAVGWAGDPEALKAEYGFETGGTVTGPDSGYFLPTTFHGTEHITPDSEMTEVKEVLGEVKDILISIRDTGGNVNKLTIQTNRLLDRVTQGGTEMRVKEIA